MDTPVQRALRFVGDRHSHWTDAKESGSADAWNTAIDALRDERAPGKERITLRRHA